VVLCGCGNWFLPLLKKYILDVFEKRMLRRIFGPKRNEIIGAWRKLHHELLRNFYPSPCKIRLNKLRRMR
jgi:hypothetical protein